MSLSGAWNGFWFRPVQAENLAICRFLFAAGMLLHYLPQDFHAYGDVPALYWTPSWLFFELGLPQPGGLVLRLVEVAWRLAFLALALGLYTRPAAVAASVGSLYLLGVKNSFPSLLFHCDTPPVFVTAILAGSRCGDALSVDSWMRRRRGLPVPRRDVEYGWPVKLVRAYLSFMFVAAGLAKVRHGGFPGWILSDVTWTNMIGANYTDIALGVPPFPTLGVRLLRLSERFATGLAALTHVTELLYPLALVSSVARVVLVPVMIVLLIGIWFIMGPFFLAAIVAHVFWVPWSRVIPRVSPRLAATLGLQPLGAGA